MLRSRRRIEANTNGLIIMTEVDWRRVWLGPRVCSVEMCPNFLDGQVAKLGMMVDKVNRDSNMLDSCSDSVGKEDVNAWLTVLIE